MHRVPFVQYPPTSFPFRDLLVFEQLPLAAEHRVCEIGVGSGGTTARLCRSCASVLGLEISAPTVEALRYLEERHPNLRLRVADVTDPKSLEGLEGSFDEVVSCDTLEHVNDAAAYFRGVATLLAPGGRFLVTFPNEPEGRMHGVTRFDSPSELRACVEQAGLTAAVVATVRLRKNAERIARTFGWRPVEVLRLVLRRGGGAFGKRAGETSNGARAPQTFDETHFFKRMDTWRRLSPAINLYWFGVLSAMEASGPCFEVDESFRVAPFQDGQVLILGAKG